MSLADQFECGDRFAVALTTSTDEAELVRHWVVRMTSATDTHRDILAAGFLPAKGTRHPSESTALADQFVFTRRPRAPRVWDVVVTYRTFGQSGPTQGQEPNPLLRGADIQWSGIPIQKPFYWARKYNQPQKAKNGRPFGGGFDTRETLVRNSAGVIYSPPQMYDDDILLATITKNMASPPAYILNYRNVINSDSVRIDGLTFPAYTLKCAPPRISGWIKEGQFPRFRQVSLLIQYKEEGWDFDIQDKGFETAVILARDDGRGTAFTKRVKITDRHGAWIKEPALLNGEGKLLKDGQDPVYFKWRKYREMPFSLLPLV